MGGGLNNNFFTQMLMNNPQLFQDPEVLQIIQDPNFNKKIQQYQQSGNIMAMFQDPQISKLMQKIQQSGGFGGMGGQNDNLNDNNNNFNEKNDKEEHHQHHDHQHHDHQHHDHQHHDHQPQQHHQPQQQNTQQKSSSKSDVELKKEKATKLFKEKKFEDAIKAYEECIEIDPKDYIYHSNILACMIELKQYEQALEKSNELIKKFDEEQIDFKIKARI